MIDTALVDHAIKCDKRYKAGLFEEVRRLTGRANPNSVAQLKEWLSANGVETESLSKKAVAEMAVRVSPMKGLGRAKHGAAWIPTGRNWWKILFRRRPAIAWRRVLKLIFTKSSERWTDAMKLTLAIGNSRKEKRWRNCEVTWTEFLDRVKNTYRTVETVAEYRQLAKAKQDELKDVGGFVGGRLKEGIRKTGYVEQRSMLTLDMDYAEADVWDFIFLLYDYACCLYSTHKHTPEAPRFRLVIPLARTVTADEYQAVARKVAEEIGIEQFDDTTYAASRLMYWPSTSSDGEYVFKSQAGQWLEPDRVLAGYNDWQDTSTWPVSSRQRQIAKQTAEKQADPTAKEGIVGSFCRAYNLEAAIHTFLADRYTPGDLPDRYTYIGGSTFGGLVIYDGSYAYSYHATDPVSGRLCNAFDLVRLHKFGALDKAADEADEGTPMSKRPSYLAMQELAIKDGAVKRQLAEDRLAKVAAGT